MSISEKKIWIVVVIFLIITAIFFWATEPQCVRTPDGTGSGIPTKTVCRPLWQALLAPTTGNEPPACATP